MTVTQLEETSTLPDTKEFIDTVFFQSLSSVNSQLVKLDTEEITMKQFRQFILEQRVWFAEQVVDYCHDLTLKSTRMEESLLSIGKELLEMHNND